MLQRSGSFTAVVFGGRGNDEWGFRREGWEVRLDHSVYQRWKHRKMRFVCSPRDLELSRERPGLVAKSSSFTPVVSTDPLRRLVADDEAVLAIAGEAAAAAATTDAWIAAIHARQQPLLPPPPPPPPPRPPPSPFGSHWKDDFRSGRWIGKWLAGNAVDARLGIGAAVQGWRIYQGRPASFTLVGHGRALPSWATAERYIYAAPASWPLGGGFPVGGELFSKQQEAFNHHSLLVAGHATTALFREQPVAAAEQETEEAEEADAQAEDLSTLMAESLEAVATRDEGLFGRGKSAETLEGLFALLEDEDNAEAAAAANEVAGNDLSKKAPSSRCGSCTECMRGDCGGCKYCLDKPKFGGLGRSKKLCLQRVCSNPQEKASTLEWLAAQQAQQAAAAAAAVQQATLVAAAPLAAESSRSQVSRQAASPPPAHPRLWPTQTSSAPPKLPAPAASLGVGHAAEQALRLRRQTIWSGITQPLLPPLTGSGGRAWNWRPAVADTTGPAAPPSLGGGAATSGQIEPPRLQLDGHAAAQQSNDLPLVELRAQPGAATLELETDATSANEAAAAKPPPLTATEVVALAEAEGLALVRSAANQSGYSHVMVQTGIRGCRYVANSTHSGEHSYSFATAEEAALHVARMSKPGAAARLEAARLAASSANTRLKARHQESGDPACSGGGGASASTHAGGGDWSKVRVATLPVTRPVALSMSKAYNQAACAATGVVWRRVGVRCSNRQPNLFTEEGRQQHTNKRMRVVKENRRHESDAHCTLHVHCTASAPHLHRTAPQARKGGDHGARGA